MHFASRPDEKCGLGSNPPTETTFQSPEPLRAQSQLCSDRKPEIGITQGGVLYLAYRRQHLKRPPRTRIPFGIRSVIMRPFVAMRALVILRAFVAMDFKPRRTIHPKNMSRERGIRCSTC